MSPISMQAISLGYAVPHRDFDSVVHSVFHSAANLCPANSTRLLTLLAPSQPDLPQGMRLDAPDDFSFDRLATGGRARCRDGILRLGELTIQLRGARRWRCDLPALGVDPAKPAISAARTLVWEALNRRQRLSGTDILADELLRPDRPPRSFVARRAGEAMRALVDVTRRNNLTDTSAVRSLIGLGSGLTPAGDDLLLGYLAGLWCTVRGKSELAEFAANLGKKVIRLSRLTNDISRTYLYHAARGQVSSALANLAEAISRGAALSIELHHAAEFALQIGHSSGMDAVTGLLVGLTAWDGK